MSSITLKETDDLILKLQEKSFWLSEYESEEHGCQWCIEAGEVKDLITKFVIKHNKGSEK